VEGAYNDFLRIIKFFIDTKTFGLEVQPRLDNNLEWDLKIFCYSDLAGDPETRVSVTRFIIYLLYVPICWCSKSQKEVTLSSTKAKYVAISESVDFKFIDYLLNDLHIKVNLPIVAKTGNIGAIFMSDYASTGFRNWQVGTHYHYVQEFIKDSFIKIDFVRSAENDFDLFTKIVNQELYEKHTRRNFWKIVKSKVPVDRYRIGRMQEIFFAINHLVLHV
jgi:hypothetical protein